MTRAGFCHTDGGQVTILLIDNLLGKSIIFTDRKAYSVECIGLLRKQKVAEKKKKKRFAIEKIGTVPSYSAAREME
jgi:hypothetical protein